MALHERGVFADLREQDEDTLKCRWLLDPDEIFLVQDMRERGIRPEISQREGATNIVWVIERP